MSDAELRYSYTCPNCSGSFSIPLERVPPVQARFRCSRCDEPMDFPSREEARICALFEAEANRGTTPGRESGGILVPVDPAAEPRPDQSKTFKVDKRGWEDDLFDRSGLRNLIRTGEVLESDSVFSEPLGWAEAGAIEELKPLFDLKKKSRFTAPPCCRSHTARLAHFFCRDSGRPLCEECAPERKFGASIVRMCLHCGGLTTELAKP